MREQPNAPAHETRTVGTAFHEILEEMANNRIDTPAFKGGFGTRSPTRWSKIADKRMPVLIGLVEGAAEELSTTRSRHRRRLDEALREADAILLEMQNILDKMIEMATYKELVEKLRKVIEQQEKLNEETKKQQVERLKSL